MAAFDKEEPTNFGNFRVFKHEELKKATNSFTTELGAGGFGSVYLGTLTDKRMVAVKLLHNDNPKRFQQFFNEMIAFSRLRHKNLVTLHGCTNPLTLHGCTNPRGKELFLVYDYVPNSTVDDHLHIRRSDLTLAIRVQIATETAEALVYLHALDPPLIHRDVKTSNIMLDDDFHVKLGDFGLCRILPWDTTQVLTVAQGTLGYRDPEYDSTCVLTVKSDVYSFGMMLVELISAQKVVDICRSPVYLADFALQKIVNKKLDDIVDPKLGYNKNIHHKSVINSLSKLAGKCLQSKGIKRPTMEQVLTELKNIDNELQEKEVLNASVIDGTSRITCFKQRFRAAVVVPLMTILCCLWHGMSCCKAKDEGGENCGTSMIACLVQRLCAPMPLMLILCCLWHYRSQCRSQCTRTISYLFYMYNVVVFSTFFYFDKHLWGHSGTNMITCLKQRFRAAVIVPLMVILCCLGHGMSYCKAKEEGGEHSGTSLIACLIRRFCITVLLMIILRCLWHSRSDCTSMISCLFSIYTRSYSFAKEEFGGHSGTGTTMISFLFAVYSSVVAVPYLLIDTCLSYFEAKEEGAENSGTIWITRLRETYLDKLFRVTVYVVGPLLLLSCCLWYYTILSLVLLVLILCCLCYDFQR